MHKIFMLLTPFLFNFCLLVTGTRVLVSQRGICIEKAGTSFFLNSVKSSLHLSQDVQGLLDYVEKVCKNLTLLKVLLIRH